MEWRIRPQWSGAVYGTMKVLGITSNDIGEAMGVTGSYVRQVLAGKKTPKDGQERVEAALECVIRRRVEGRRDGKNET